MALSSSQAGGLECRRRGTLSNCLLHAALLVAAVVRGITAGALAETPANSTLPQVTVEAQRAAVEKSIHTFVSNLTHVPVGSEEEALPLWGTPICFLVGGLPRVQAEFVVNRISEVAASAGAPLAGDHCRPNFFVVVTSQPEAFLKAWRHHDHGIYGYAGPAPVNGFIDVPRPVRIWYNTELTDSQGAPLAFGSNIVASNMSSNIESSALAKAPSVAGSASRLEYNAVRDFSSVIAIVDINRVKNLEWGQVADYIAVAGLTSVNLDADFKDSASILRLFTSSAEVMPKGLSAWDTSFLKALYHTRQGVVGQRVEIAGHMLGDIAP